jgi:hypothetical protein
MSSRKGRSQQAWLGLVASMLLALMTSSVHSFPARAESEPGAGLGPGSLWVNATLHQPPGHGGSASRPRSGWAIRYEQPGVRPGCIPLPNGGVPAGLLPWFGAANSRSPDVHKAAVVRVNRANPTIRQTLGTACLNPGDLVQTPTQEEVFAALDQDIIARPQMNSSPGNRGLTGMESWFWTSSDGHAGVAINLRGFTVQATADAKFHWSTGDDGNYETGSGGTPQNPAVRHVYNSKSPGSGYNVTLDMIWEGEYNWFGFGDAGAGQLGPVTRSGTRSYPVNEVRSVLQ